MPAKMTGNMDAYPNPKKQPEISLKLITTFDCWHPISKCEDVGTCWNPARIPHNSRNSFPKIVNLVGAKS